MDGGWPPALCARPRSRRPRRCRCGSQGARTRRFGAEGERYPRCPPCVARSLDRAINTAAHTSTGGVGGKRTTACTRSRRRRRVCARARPHTARWRWVVPGGPSPTATAVATAIATAAIGVGP